MLTKAKISNFKCIELLEVPLARFMAFVGPNDSGKTSILQAIRIGATGEVDKPRIQKSFAPYAYWSKKENIRPKVQLWRSPVDFWTREVGNARAIPVSYDENNPELVIEETTAPEIPTFFYTSRPAQLKRPSYLPPNHQTVTILDPYALPSILTYLLGEDRETFLEIEQRLHAFVPTVKSIVLKRCPVEDDKSGDCLWFDLVSGERVPSIMMSDGTIALLGYLAVLLTPPRPELLLIDGPEEGIHPYALRKLVEFFREMQRENSNLQILVTSHSPDLLSLLEPQEIILTYREEGGYTQAACLKDHPDIEQWLNGLTPGELWLWDGEQELIQRIRTAEETSNG